MTISDMNNLVDLFNPEHYTHLEGGVLESCGRLFKDGVRVMVYPMLGDQLRRSVTPEINAISTIFLGISVLFVTIFFLISRKKN